MYELAKSIRLLRQKRGMTQAQLAKAAGIGGLLISRIETGRSTRPSSNVLNKVCVALVGAANAPR